MRLEDDGGDEGPPRGPWLSPVAVAYLQVAFFGLVLIVVASVVVWVWVT